MAVLHEKLKKQLKEEHKRLKAQLSTFPVNDRGAIGYSTHQTDDATLAYDQAAEMAMRRNAERLLYQIERALHRMRPLATGDRISRQGTRLNGVNCVEQ